MIASAGFLMICCQAGAEAALKAEIGRLWPAFRFSYSRRGFVTFKLPGDHGLADDFDLKSVFARCYSFSLLKLAGDRAQELAQQFWSQTRPCEPDHLHVWERERALPGTRGYEPGTSALAGEIGRILSETAPFEKPPRLNRRARAGESILDCCLVEPSEWWVGFHRASSVPTRWPGGAIEIKTVAEAVSRAYRKMAEAIQWARFPIHAGDRCVEIGSSPGGASQALLEQGLLVTGIDPAEMEPAVLEHPNFTHLRKRGADVRRAEYRGFKWLVADSNVAPHKALETIESIVTHEKVNVRGLLLTLKLSDWDLASQVPAYIERVRSWGYGYVRARQLANNRQEVCIAALQDRTLRRL